jgi:hypothetical protein
MRRTLFSLAALLALAGVAAGGLNITLKPAPTATVKPAPSSTTPLPGGGVEVDTTIAEKTKALCEAASNPYTVSWSYDAETHKLSVKYIDVIKWPNGTRYSSAITDQARRLVAYIKANIDPAATFNTDDKKLIVEKS